MAQQRLPLVPSDASYRLGTNLGGVQYVIDIRWNGRDAAWYMDLYTEDETPIRRGMKIVLGGVLGWTCRDPNMPQAFFAPTDLSLSGVDASFNDLGERVVVDYIPFADITEEG